MFWMAFLSINMIFNSFNVARVKVIYGDAMVLPYGAEDWEYIFRNSVITEGDIVKTLNNGKLVFTFGEGQVVSIGRNSKVEINALNENFAFRLLNGTMRVMSKDAEGIIDIISTSIYVYPYTTVKVQRRGALVKVSVVRGEVEVEDEIVRAGDMARIYPEGKIVIRREFYHDEFDRWASEYEREYIVVREVRYIPEGICVGVYDLDRFGRWRYVRGYGWVWIPQVGPDWRPYYYGHWVFRVRVGWVWVSYEEWGWVPYHYGRWAWISGIGWVWVPGSEWRGAWVVWYEGPSWISWAPLDPYGRPIVYINRGGRRRWVAPVVDYRSFRKPVYRYKPPKNGVYKKPVYRTVNLNAKKVDFERYEKPVIGVVPPHVKPVFKREWKNKVKEIEKKPQIVKRPLFDNKLYEKERVKEQIEQKPYTRRKSQRAKREVIKDTDNKKRNIRELRREKERRKRIRKDTTALDTLRRDRDKNRKRDYNGVIKKLNTRNKRKSVRTYERKKDNEEDRKKDVDLMKKKVNNK